jgi:hypothetical protein
MSSARCLVAVVVLCIVPATLSAQRIASVRSGIVPRVALAGAAHAETMSTDSVAPHHSQLRSRLEHTLAGGLIGGATGLLAGFISVNRSNHHCAHSYDSCDGIGVLIPVYGAIGFGAGLIVGALWPTR